MKKLSMMKFVSLVLTLFIVGMLGIPKMSMAAAQLPVNLGMAENFAVLAGSTITNTGTSIINGNNGSVGLYPGTSFVGQTYITISGEINVNDAIAIQAKVDLAKAYDEAKTRMPVVTIPTELGGTTLTPGNYDSADGTFQITGTLTLDAQGDPNAVFIFKTDTTLITASYSNVILINNAEFIQTYWKVGSSATLGINSHLEGSILAMTSITLNTSASVKGQLLALNGAVTLDSNIITNGEILVTTTPIVTNVFVTTTPQNSSTVRPTATATAKTPTKTPTAAPAIKATATTTPTAYKTITGGQLPRTSMPFYEYLFLGISLTSIGLVLTLKSKKKVFIK